MNKSSESYVLDVPEERSLTLETIHKLKRDYDNDDCSRDCSNDKEKEEDSNFEDKESDSGFKNCCRIIKDSQWKTTLTQLTPDCIIVKQSSRQGIK